MKSIKASKLIFIFLLVIFFVLLIYSYIALPAKVAVHFSADGVPNNWQSKTHYVLSFGLTGIFLSLFIIILFRLIKYIPKGLINLPNKDYWLSLDQIQQTTADLKEYGIWLADILLFIFIIGGTIILNANIQLIVRSVPMYFILVIIFLPIIIFFWKFFKRFSRTD